MQRILVVLAIGLLVSACGRSERVPTSITRQSATTPTWDTREVLTPITQTPMPDVATLIAKREALMVTETARQATSFALPTFTPGGILATFPPEPTRQSLTGIHACTAQEYKQIHYYTTEICWTKQLPNGYMNVTTGGDISTMESVWNNTNRGGLRIVTSTLNVSSDGIMNPVYWTPTNQGTITIQSVQEPLMYLSASGGGTFTFNLDTRQWVTNNSTPTATNISR